MLRDVNGVRLDEVAGFYAIAYDWGGEKIISYRGTAESEGSGSDVWNGWRLGAGFPQASQGRLAQDFYKAVTGYSVFDANGPDSRDTVMN